MLNKNIKKLIYGIILVIITNLLQYYITTQNQSDILKKEYKIKQLQEFYLPFKNTLHHSKLAWLEYKKKYGEREQYLRIVSNEVNEETLMWRIYMLSQFKEIHVQFETLLKKRNLVIKSKKLNDALNVLYKHISEYKIIFYQWNINKSTKNIAITHFPDKLRFFIDKDIDILQSQLGLQE